MSRLLNRLTSTLVGTFVAQGVGIDDDGCLCLPDDLTPQRVQRFIELVTAESYPHPRAAMHDLFTRVGVRAPALSLLDEIVHDGGDIDMVAAAHHWTAVLAALPALHEIPRLFRDFLVHDLALASPESESLEAAVVSTRENAAARLGCRADWDAILERPDAAAALVSAWRAAGITAARAR